MSEYYGVQRSTSLSHYGVKGMKWGVRKAIKKGDKAKLKKHHDKAVQKLYSLHDKANLLTKKSERVNGRWLAGLGTGAAAAGTAANYLIFNDLKKGRGVLIHPAAPAMPLAGAAAAGIGAYQAISARKRSGSKGHAKTVEKVNDWQKAMKETFKGTAYESEEKGRKPYKDVYSVKSYKKEDIDHWHPKTVATISGSKLVRNYKGKDKDKFVNIAKKPLHTIAAPNTHDYDPNSGQETHVTEYLTGVYGKYPKQKKRKSSRG